MDKDETKLDDTAEDNTEKEFSPEVVIEEEDPIALAQKLKEKLKSCEKERQEYLDGWQRSRAEFVNTRKRDEQGVKEIIEYAHESLLAELIPVLDSISTATANKDAWEKIDPNWRSGVEQIFSQLRGVLEREGLSVIRPMNEKYDPAKHEAVASVEVADESEDQIVQDVVAPGYALKGRLIRAPKVKIGEYIKGT